MEKRIIAVMQSPVLSAKKGLRKRGPDAFRCRYMNRQAYCISVKRRINANIGRRICQIPGL
ncbi:MAG: hypothetical protein ACSW8K_07910 [bacterium]